MPAPVLLNGVEVATDTLGKPAQIIGRYAARWSMEAAIERTVPFGQAEIHTLRLAWETDAA